MTTSIRSGRAAAARGAPWGIALTTSLVLAAPAAAQLAKASAPGGLQYPAARTVQQVDDYHGTKVADPYRWLEDDRSAETAAWVQAQNALTFGYLATLPHRAELRRRLEQVYDYPKLTLPRREGSWLFYQKNDGLQNLPVIYGQRDGASEPEVLLDPNTLSSDGSTVVYFYVPSKGAKYLAYQVSQGGSDWSEIRILDLATRRTLPDRVRWVKASTIAWRGDGFYYSRYPAPADTTQLLSAKNEHHQVWYHRVGTPQSADELVYEDRAHPLRFHMVSVTDDERFLILDVSDRGAGKDGNAVHVLDTRTPEKGFRPLIADLEHRYGVIDHEDGKFIVSTTLKAPTGRVVLIDPERPQEEHWQEIFPAQPEPRRISMAGGKFFVTYSKDVTDRVFVHDRSGRLEREIELPGPGVAFGFYAKRTDTELFWQFESLTTPPTIYRYDVAKGTSTVFWKPELPFDASAFETTQVFFDSRDGTRVPMFLVHRKGLERNGRNPTLIYGYGGFGITQFPTFDPLLVPLLERGAVYAVVGLRGGREYGGEWHHAGWREKKQNVFDDFIAATEWLQRNGYTSPEHCGWHGVSNGGLLVGAVMTQRPELCRVALPAVGVMDMLRFHRFTIGWNWIAEYGSSEDPKMFPVLHGYSPLHNLKEGVRYPATLVTTADHDDRVVPAHSFKFAATLQAKGAGPNPYLIRIETNSGHGAISTGKRLDEAADQYAFFLRHASGDAVP